MLMCAVEILEITAIQMFNADTDNFIQKPLTCEANAEIEYAI